MGDLNAADWMNAACARQGSRRRGGRRGKRGKEEQRRKDTKERKSGCESEREKKSEQEIKKKPAKRDRRGCESERERQGMGRRILRYGAASQPSKADCSVPPLTPWRLEALPVGCLGNTARYVLKTNKHQQCANMHVNPTLRLCAFSS